MSVKTYNPETRKWEVRASSTAMNTRVLDASGYYESSDTEGCFKEIGEQMSYVRSDIEWLREHGGGGSGGSGGGGGYGPTITLESDESADIPTGTDYYVYFYFKSSNKGKGTLYVRQDYLTIDTVVGIDQGSGYYVFKNLEKGEHTLSLSVMDSAGEISDSISVSVTVGGLELTSRYDDSMDLSLLDEINIQFTIDTISKAPIFVTFTLDGVETVRELSKGTHTWNIGKLSTMGVHPATIKAESGELVSNTLVFNLVLADTDNLYVSTTSTITSIPAGKNLQLDYRNSMLGETRFYTDLYINGVVTDTVVSYPGYNFWNIGDGLAVGRYEFKLISYTYPNRDKESNTLVWNIDVVAEGYTPWEIVTDGLICNFDANGKQQDSTTRTTWTDTSGNNIKCTLHNFNFVSNGWIDNSLKFTGRCYADIDYAPFADGCPNGLTFDILFKVKDVGDIDGKVLYCKNNITPYQGIYIDTYRSNHRSAQSKITECGFQDDTWTRATYVIDRDGKMMYQYINAVITRCTRLSTGEDFRFDGKITLGASFDEEKIFMPSGDVVDNIDEDGNPISHFANCSIKYLRIYNRALSDDEILHNHIADIKDKEEQLAKRELNFGDSTIPVMLIQGNLDSMEGGKTDAIVTIDYEDPLDQSKRFRKEGCLIRWQGTSSLEYPVKNYTIKLRDGGNDWLYAPKDNWIPESRYTLKANFMDSSQVNNVGTARFAHDMLTETGNLYPSQVKNPKCRGSIDGFPIRLVMNGKNMGIYMFNIDRYATRNWGLEGEDLAISYEISVNSTTGAGAFADDSWTSIRNEFEYRYHYAGDEDVVCETVASGNTTATLLKAGYHNDLVNLVSWTKNCTNEEFRSQVSQHWSLPHLIDYYLLVYSLGLVDNFGKNMVITTWGPNTEGDVIWYPSLYDCDSMMGLTNDGELRYSPGIDPMTGDYNTSDSVLWTKLKNNFASEISERYVYLRANKYLTVKKLLDYYEGISNTIGESFYNDDQRIKYINENTTHLNKCNGSRLEHTKRWLTERITYMDSVYEYGDWQLSATIRTNDVTGEASFQLRSASPMLITVSFSDQNTGQMKAYCDKNKLYTFRGVIENPKDNNVFIKGITNVAQIEGLEFLNVSSLILGNAKKLTNINIEGSTRIQQLSLSSNTMLQKLNCKNCKNLGIDDNYKSLDLTNCENLKYLDLSNTKIGEVELSEGGSLEYLNMSNSGITNLNVIGYEYLPEILMENCNELAKLIVKKCNALTRLVVTHSKLNTLTIEDCDALEYLDFSYTGQLVKPVLNVLPGLKTLKLAGLSNPGFTELDLRNIANLESLDISKCDFVTNIRFQQGYTKLKELLVMESAIKTIQFGNEAIPSYLDLSKFVLSNVSFYNCAGVEEIRGLNLVATGSMSPFNNCINLHTIQGNVTLRDSIYRGFYNCTKLVNLPTLDLSNVTSISECFMYCKAFTWNTLTTILSKLTKCQDFYHGFTGCSGIVKDGLPADMFKNNTKMTNLYWTFLDTGIKGQLSPGIFDPLVNLQEIRRPFNNLTGYVPPNLFKKNTQLTLCADLFQDMTGMTVGMDETTFATCTKLKDVYGLFTGASNAVMTLNGNFFKNCPIRNADNLFTNCKKLTGSIPATLFPNKTSLESCYNLFAGCSGLSGEIPPEFFNGYKNLRDINQAFQGCSGLSGPIKTSLWSNSDNITVAYGLFDGCSGLGGDPSNIQEIPTDFFKGKYMIANVSRMFKNCNQLKFTLPDYFFKDCRLLNNVSEVFYNCANLSGRIPEHLFVTLDENGEEIASPIDYANGVFRECQYLEGQIPENLFDRFLTVKDLSNFFQGCRRLTRGIPAKLFNRCYSLVSINHMFADAAGLGRETIEDFEEDPYFVDENLFANCPDLTNMVQTFFMWRGWGTSLRGEIPPRLFANNKKLKNMEGTFIACNLLTGGLDNMLFRNCPKLTTVKDCFWACSGLNGELGSNLFSSQYNPLIADFSQTFSGCSNLTGTSPSLWTEFPSATRSNCFTNCTSLANYDSIPAGWK